MLTTSFPRYRGDFAGVFVYNLAHELAEQGVEVSVVAPHDGHAPNFEINGSLDVHRFTYMWPRRWQQLAYGNGIFENLRRCPWVALQLPGFLVMFLREAWRVCADCDVVHVHWAPLAWLGLALRWRYRTPVVLTVHGTDVRSFPAFLIRPAMKRLEAIIAAAPETEMLLQKLGITSYHAIPLPIDRDKFQPGMDAGTVGEELGLRPGDDVVTFVGRLNEFRDPMTLIRAAPFVLALRPQTRFVVVGDGPLAAPLRAAVDAMGLQGMVHLMGARGDVGRFLALAKVFVALSPVDNAWSMALAEAMHMQTPCIITRAGQTERVFTHMENAYLIPPQDEQALAQAIVYLSSHKEVRDRLVCGASHLMKQYGKDNASITQRMMGVYESVMVRRERGAS